MEAELVPLPQDPEKIEFYKAFVDESKLLGDAWAKAFEVYGFDQLMFREAQDERKNSWDFDNSSYKFKPKPQKDPGPIRLFDIPEIQCPVCNVIFQRKIDLVEHCYRNKDTIFHEVL